MIAIMLSGQLAKLPETRTSKNGNAYRTAAVRVQTAEDDMYVNITAFSPLADALAGLQRGDPITVTGTAKLSAYQGKDGEARVGLSIVASRIIALTDHQSPPRPKANTGHRQGRCIQPDEREYAPDEDICF